MASVGINIFYITPTETRHLDSDCRKTCRLIVSIDNGDDLHVQFGPILSDADNKAIARILNSCGTVKGHQHNICWFLLDLMRLNPYCQETPHILALKDVCIFNIHKTYEDSQQNRHQCAKIAYYHARRQSASSPYTNLPVIPMRLVAPQAVIDIYANALPFLRGKWLEIQGETVELYDFKIQHSPTTHEDTTLNRGDSTRFTMTLSAWPTHMVLGTELELDIKGEEEPVIPTKVRIDNRRIIFIIAIENLTADDIEGGRICRSNEKQTSIIETLCTGVTILTQADALSNNRLMCAILGLPSGAPPPSDTAERSMAILHQPVRPKEVTRSRWSSMQRRYERERTEQLHNIREDIASPCFTQMNTVQAQCASSAAEVTCCCGYPGTGKTKTLAAYALKRFQHCLPLPCGWIVCLTNSNVSACTILEHLLSYPSIVPYLKHAYSSLYAAFHPEEIKASFPFRVTPNDKLKAHGILVCTIGKFSNVTKKFPMLQKRIFDIIFDEGGQIWNLTGLTIAYSLPGQQRVGIFGDTKQLPPYVTRLAGLRNCQPSIMTPFTKTNSATTNTHYTCTILKLDTQYRMTPAICNAHRPLFYDYPIITGRSGPCNPLHDGMYVDLLENPPGTGRHQYGEVSAQRAIAIFQRLHQLDLRRSCGTPYTYRIITPYVTVLERLVQLRKLLPAKQRGSVVIRTIDTSQGSEADVVIYVAGRPTLSDLNTCPFRGNVALSRAKNLLVVIGTMRFWAGHFPRQDRLNHWGGWLLAESVSLLANDPLEFDQLKLNVWLKAARRKRNREDTRKVNHAQTTALMILDQSFTMDIHRNVLAKSLALKTQYWMNHPRNKLLFAAYVHCTPEQFQTAVMITASTSDNNQRYEKLSSLFQLDPSLAISQNTETLVRSMYTVWEKPRRNTAHRSNRQQRHPQSMRPNPHQHRKTRRS